MVITLGLMTSRDRNPFVATDFDQPCFGLNHLTRFELGLRTSGDPSLQLQLVFRALHQNVWLVLKVVWYMGCKKGANRRMLYGSLDWGLRAKHSFFFFFTNPMGIVLLVTCPSHPPSPGAHEFSEDETRRFAPEDPVDEDAGHVARCALVGLSPPGPSDNTCLRMHF